jgi:uncharacterized protein YdcH (DUF465 family)
LAERHHSLDEQIAALESKPFLTADEEIEEHRLKKLKLSCKDQMSALLQHH